MNQSNVSEIKQCNARNARTTLILALAVAGVGTLAPSHARAALKWDANTVTANAQDGAGTWDITTANWYDTTTSTDVQWPNTTAAVATFGNSSGAAGIVTVTGAGVIANGITFNAAGSGNYTLSTGGISFGGTTPTITTNVNAIINSPLTASGGLTKSGTAQLTLGGDNSNVSSFNFTAGTTVINAVNALGASTTPISIGSNATLSISSSAGGAGGGAITLNGGAITLGSNGLVTSSIDVASSSTLNPYSGEIRSTITGSANLAVATVTHMLFSGSLSSYNGTIDGSNTTGSIRLAVATGPTTGGVGFDMGSSGTGDLLTDGSGTFKLGSLAGGSNTTLSGARYNNSAVSWQIGDLGATTTFAGTIRNNSTNTFTITGNTVSINKVGAGTLSLTNAGSVYTGVTTATAGILKVTKLSDIGSASSIGFGDSTSTATNTASLVLNGGTLQYAGTGDSSNRLFNFNVAGGTFNASGSAALNLTNSGAIGMNNPSQNAGASYATGATTITVADGTALRAGMGITGTGIKANTSISGINGNVVTLSQTTSGSGTTATALSFFGGSRTLTLGGTNAASNTLAASIADASGSGVVAALSSTSLVKGDAGTWVLSNASTYTGTTTVSGGILNVTGSVSGNNSSKVMIASDALANGTQFSSSAPTLARAIASGSTAAGGMGSTVVGDSFGGLFVSTADILNSAGALQAHSLSMAWRDRAGNEKPGSSNGGPFGNYTPAVGLASDVVNIMGLEKAGGATSADGDKEADAYVLQMKYDPASISAITGLGESQAAAAGLITLDYLDLGADGVAGGTGSNADIWKLATAGDFNNADNPQNNVQGAYVSSTYGLNVGDYGVDTANHVVWAIVDHDSQFAAVPEPGAFALIAVGSLALLARRRRKAGGVCDDV